MSGFDICRQRTPEEDKAVREAEARRGLSDPPDPCEDICHPEFGACCGGKRQ